MAEIGTDILKAKLLLEQGQLVAIPTETVYGLAGNALNTEAVTKIFEVKNRPQFDPLIVHVVDIEHALTLVEDFPEKALLLAQKFWPGPLTLVLKKKSVIPDLISSGMDTVGIRCPAHPLTQRLLNNLSFPLAAPSANPFGYVSPTQPMHVEEQLGNKISYILDGGVCDVGIESTIVGFDTGVPTIYRMGGIEIEELERVTGKVNILTHSSSNPKAPGQLKSHYAPRKRIVMGDLDKLINTTESDRYAILSFSKSYPDKYQFILSPSGTIEEAAKNLFLALRTLDKMPVEVIFAEWVPDEGLGKAINDRLRRASFAE